MASPIGRNSPSRWETPEDVRRRKEAAERRVKERHRLLAVQTREKHKVIAEERARLTAELKEKETKALKKEQEELNKRMAQFERDKAYKQEVLARQHAMKSRTSANPKVAFGSASPRELSYLDNLSKEQKAYDKKLSPPSQQVLPRTTRTSMGAMTTSLYVSSTPKRPATSRPSVMTRTPQPAKSQLMTQSFYSPARPATTASRNSTPRRAPTTTIAKSVPNSAARTTTPARAVPPKAANAKLPPKKPATPIAKVSLPTPAKVEPETPVHEEVHVDMGSTDGERGDSPKPKGDILPEEAVVERQDSSDHSKVNVSTNGLSSLLEEPIIVAEQRNETLTTENIPSDVTPSIVSPVVPEAQEDTNTAFIIQNETEAVPVTEEAPVVEEEEPVGVSLADELSQALGGEDGHDMVQEVQAVAETHITAPEQVKGETGIDLATELGQVSLETPATLIEEPHSNAVPEVVITPEPVVSDASAVAEVPQEHLEEPVHSIEAVVLPSETEIPEVTHEDKMEDSLKKLDLDSLELNYQVPEVEKEDAEVVAPEKEQPESIPEQETVASKPPTPPVPKVDEESLIRRKEEDRRHNEDIRARLAAVKAKIGRTSPPNGTNDGEARSASPPTAAVAVAPVAPSNPPPATTISASTAALLQRLQAAGKVKTNGVGNILARHASDPKLDAPEDPISAE